LVLDGKNYSTHMAVVVIGNQLNTAANTKGTVASKLMALGSKLSNYVGSRLQK